MNYLNKLTGEYPVSESMVRLAYPNTSFPVPFKAPEEYALVFQSPQPTFDALTHSVREIAPVLTNKGHYEQAWEVVALDTEQIEANQAAKAVADAKLINDKIEALWSAADRYTSGHISGVAIGILTIGVMQQKPKALAVTGWSSAIWAEYYARKALVTVTSTDDHDFTGFGAIPFSVPELQAEIGL